MKTKTKTASREFLTPAPESYLWPRCPEADLFVEETVRHFLKKHVFASRLAERMKTETSTLFSAWVDHIVLPKSGPEAGALARLGFVPDKKARCPGGAVAYWHPFADLPRVLVSSKARGVGCAVMVEDLWRFQAANGLSLPIDGAPCSTYRSIRLPEGSAELSVIERRGAQNFVPDSRDRAGDYLRNFERWATRPRRFPSESEGMKATLALARELVRDLGTGLAAHIFLHGERVYWQSRNRAGQIQKARQDRLGLGWANHDHHTFRSSRSTFPMLIAILLTFGFKKRERYYAGAEAGWGAQVMEQPEDGTIIFADVDLSPVDVNVDFSKIALPDLNRPGTVGLWCALHGESMLQAGMHHLEAKFDYEQLRVDLKERGVETMAPFTDFPHLRQAFTKAEMWTVPEARLAALRTAGRLSDEAYQQIRAKGAVGSHLENLQRRDGFKGFNQKGVSHIIAAVNPEKQALTPPAESGGA